VNNKIIIYQVFPRLFGNRNLTNKRWGTIAENGCGKMNDFDEQALQRIRKLGISHIWFTGIIRHASQTDYSEYGIPTQHSVIVKGRAGSPYAITDYYDVSPDLAVDVEHRLEEFKALVQRVHKCGMKVIVDFVPNHVAREYKSVCRPNGVADLGENDDTSLHFSTNNNFYYCWGKPFEPSIPLTDSAGNTYHEQPAKATGNDRFDNHPGINDWYETIKLNYGVDYCDAAGRSEHFVPVPDTWKKMVDILLFWADAGVDGFRCDMVEMVPTAFWQYATGILKENYPQTIVIGEVYDPYQYRAYVQSGFDYLYDKVGMYDCMKSIVRQESHAAAITHQWQSLDDIGKHMLYFLENHDEQRIASPFFCGDAQRAIPALIVSALMQRNPMLIYAGQEFGEPGMDNEGFSGIDGRTTIFDYWTVGSLYRGYFDREKLSAQENDIYVQYQQILRIARGESAIGKGLFFDLMYVNPQSDNFNPARHFAFLRKWQDELLLVVVNFSGENNSVQVNIPGHAFDYLQLPEGHFGAIDLLTGETTIENLGRDGNISMTLAPYNGRIFKFNTKMKDDELLLCTHNKDEFPPAHTAEHLLNQVMIRMFDCGRSTNAHVERKKSKISYTLDRKPSRQDEKEIERRMNELIEEDLPVTYELVDRYDLPEGIDLSRVPDDYSNMVRIVRIGDFDACPCIGKHVRSTGQIGKFVLLGTNWDEPTRTFRVRFKLV